MKQYWDGISEHFSKHTWGESCSVENLRLLQRKRTWLHQALGYISALFCELSHYVSATWLCGSMTEWMSQ